MLNYAILKYIKYYQEFITKDDFQTYRLKSKFCITFLQYHLQHFL